MTLGHLMYIVTFARVVNDPGGITGKGRSHMTLIKMKLMS